MPIVFTFPGTVNVDIAQYAKVSLFISAIPAPIVTVSSFEHLKNAFAPISFKLSGKDTAFKTLQYANASSPMLTNPSFKVKVVNASQAQNASSPMLITDDGISISVNAQQE